MTGPRKIRTHRKPDTRIHLVLVATLAIIGAIAACGDAQQQENAMTTEEQVTAAQWQAVASRRIVFGHQSVGRNILAGMAALAADAGADVPVIESRTPAGAPGITHFAVGRNGNPLEKCADFAGVVAENAQAGIDVALMKLCYVDFPTTRDPRETAAVYCDTLDDLARRFPSTTFAAVTSPLTTVQAGPRAALKRLLGKVPLGYAENERRQIFNDILRARYGDSGRLFDLAAIESGGAVCRVDGHDVACLDPAISSDGGHLNDQGARRVASHFVAFLAGLPR